MTPASFQATCHFTYVFLCINIFRHTYISLYRFLYIFWYITMSNYASIKNNWYKSYVTTAITPLVACVLWRHSSDFPSSASLAGGTKWVQLILGRCVGASNLKITKLSASNHLHKPTGRQELTKIAYPKVEATVATKTSSCLKCLLAKSSQTASGQFGTTSEN